VFRVAHPVQTEAGICSSLKNQWLDCPFSSSLTSPLFMCSEIFQFPAESFLHRSKYRWRFRMGSPPLFGVIVNSCQP